MSAIAAAKTKSPAEPVSAPRPVFSMTGFARVSARVSDAVGFVLTEGRIGADSIRVRGTDTVV